jgi:hypothetical protein
MKHGNGGCQIKYPYGYIIETRCLASDDVKILSNFYNNEEARDSTLDTHLEFYTNSKYDELLSWRKVTSTKQEVY